MKIILFAIILAAVSAYGETENQSNILPTSDYSSFGYSGISVGNNPLTGIKYNGVFAAALYRQQKADKKYVMTAGLEFPVDIELPIKRIMPYAAGGFQFGTDSALYGELGLDARLSKMFKIQIGVHLPFGFDAAAQFGAAYTW